MDRYRMELNGGEPWAEPDSQGLRVLHEDAEAAVLAEREACAAYFDDSDTMIYRSEVAAAIRRMRSN